MVEFLWSSFSLITAEHALLALAIFSLLIAVLVLGRQKTLIAVIGLLGLVALGITPLVAPSRHANPGSASTLTDTERQIARKRVYLREAYKSAVQLVPETKKQGLYFELTPPYGAAYFRFSIAEAGPYNLSAISRFRSVDLEYALYSVHPDREAIGDKPSFEYISSIDDTFDNNPRGSHYLPAGEYFIGIQTYYDPEDSEILFLGSMRLEYLKLMPQELQINSTTMQIEKLTGKQPYKWYIVNLNDKPPCVQISVQGANEFKPAMAIFAGDYRLPHHLALNSSEEQPSISLQFDSRKQKVEKNYGDRLYLRVFPAFLTDPGEYQVWASTEYPDENDTCETGKSNPVQINFSNEEISRKIDSFTKN